MAACASCYRLNPSRAARAAAAFGLCITTLMIVVKLIPLIPGHFSLPEWVSLAIWLALGIIIHRSAAPRADAIATRRAAGSDVA
jgi:uncharacterized protein (DUF983 family)